MKLRNRSKYISRNVFIRLSQISISNTKCEARSNPIISHLNPNALYVRSMEASKIALFKNQCLNPFRLVWIIFWENDFFSVEIENTCIAFVDAMMWNHFYDPNTTGLVYCQILAQRFTHKNWLGICQYKSNIVVWHQNMAFLLTIAETHQLSGILK